MRTRCRPGANVLTEHKHKHKHQHKQHEHLHAEELTSTIHAGDPRA